MELGGRGPMMTKVNLSKRWTFSETMDIRDFTVCIIHCVYRAELILVT